VAYILVLAGLSLAGLLSGMILLLVSLMNVLSYWLYAQDKEAAQLGNRRIPENTLHLVAFLGGGRQPGWHSKNYGIKHKNNPSGKFIFVL
jgi:Predicted membrane protein